MLERWCRRAMAAGEMQVGGPWDRYTETGGNPRDFRRVQTRGKVSNGLV